MHIVLQANKNILILEYIYYLYLACNTTLYGPPNLPHQSWSATQVQGYETRKEEDLVEVTSRSRAEGAFARGVLGPKTTLEQAAEHLPSRKCSGNAWNMHIVLQANKNRCFFL